MRRSKPPEQLDFMSVSLAHLKLTVRDVFHAQTGDENNSYICKFYNTAEDRPILFRNCRLSGICVEHMSDSAYVLDDGTGMIQVTIPPDCPASPPNIGDYVEVLGRIQGNIGRYISLLCSNVRNDPMEEVRHLLEQAAIHRDMLRFEKSSQERYLSSDPAATTGFERLSDVVLDILSKCDSGTGITHDQISAVCEGDSDVTQRLIQHLNSQGYVWSSDDGKTFFPL
jgi:hypothetical protein